MIYFELKYNQGIIFRQILTLRFQNGADIFAFELF